MSPALVFLIGNALAPLGWLLLLLLPTWRGTQRVVHGGGILLVLLGILYTYLLASSLIATGQVPDFGSIDGIRALMADDRALVAGWLHYLAFDLFVGSWQVLDGQRRGIGRLWLAPCLVLTFLAGPVGLLAYLALRNFVGTKES